MNMMANRRIKDMYGIKIDEHSTILSTGEQQTEGTEGLCNVKKHLFRGTAPKSAEIDSFVGHLEENGWNRTVFKPDVQVFSKHTECPVSGTLTYKVYFDAFGAAKWRGKEMEGRPIVYLLGPTRKVLTGKIIQQVRLASWKTMLGAHAGVIKQFEAEHKRFVENSQKALDRRIKKDMKRK